MLTYLSQFVFKRRWWYRNIYLRSEHWKKTRLRKLKQAGFQCSRCYLGSKQALLDVHHLTYERLFRERMGDLQVLCRTCHRREHGLIKVNSSGKMLKM